MKWLFYLTLFLFPLFIFNPPVINASSIGQCTGCSGTFDCFSTQCNWSDASCTGNCSSGQTDPLCGTCSCTTNTTTRTCSSTGSECLIADVGCDAGNTAATDCSFPVSCGGGGGSFCGDGTCDAGETNANCPADCPICGAGFQYCGGCIDSCRSTSQSCTAWIDQECSSGGSCPTTGPECWCTTASECSAFPGPSTWVTDDGYCDESDGQTRSCCCTDCLLGTTTEDAGCGNGSCSQCQMLRTKRAISNPGVFCGQFCAADTSCSAAGSCNPRCGQSNGCGGTCSNTDGGTPTGVTLTPSPGSTLTVVNSAKDGSPPAYTATISWTTSNKADYYEYEFYPQVDQDCASANADCSTTTATSYTFTPISGIVDYAFKVRGVNSTCSLEPGIFASTSFTLVADITGTFYQDDDASATLVGGVCSDGPSTAISPGTGSSIGAEGFNGSVGGVIAGSTYSITVPFWPSPTGDNTVDLNPGTGPGGATYLITCPDASGIYNGGIFSPQAGVDFYMTEVDLTNDGWFQAMGGNIYAGLTSGEALRTYVPVDTCDAAAPACTSAVIDSDEVDTPDSAGAAITAGGSIDTSDENGNQTGYISDRTTQLVVSDSEIERIKEGYDYFYREYSMGSNPSGDFIGTENDAQKPTSPPADGKRAYFHSGDLEIADPWLVTAGEEIVVFVDGNLRIGDPTNNVQMIDVEEGGFLAFVVSANIAVRSNVGNAADLTGITSNIEGVYITDGLFRVLSVGEAGGGDERFVGEGIFVAWSGFDLLRDFSDGGLRKAENNDKAVELFKFRPDLVLNAPDRMKKPRFIWQETN